MARQPDDDRGWWTIAGVTGGAAAGCFFLIARAGVEATSEDPLDLTRGWLLATAIVGAACLGLFLVIILGLLTPLLNLPHPSDGPLYVTRIRERMGRRRSEREGRAFRVARAVPAVRKELGYNKAVLELARVTGNFWDEENDLRDDAWRFNAPYFARHRASRGFRARTEDAYWKLKRPAKSVRATGYRASMTSQDKAEVDDAIAAIEEALAVDVSEFTP